MSRNSKRHNLPRRRRSRRGTATVEFAVCLPVILTLVLGAIECCSMIFVQQSLEIIAYEGASVVIRPDGTSADAQARCDQIIAERDLNDVTVAFNPGNVEAVSRRTPITVTVSAPTDANSVMKLKFFSGDLQSQTVMIKE